MTSLAESHELRGRKLWISFFNIKFSIFFPCMFYGIPFFYIPLLPEY